MSSEPGSTAPRMVYGARRLARLALRLLFIARPVILDMAALDITLKEYRDLLNGLGPAPHPRSWARKTSRPRLGRTAPASPGRFRGAANRQLGRQRLREDAPAPREEDAPSVAQTAPERTESLVVDGNVRSGQTIMHPQGDVTIIGRVASGAEIVAGPAPFTSMERCRAG